MLDELNIFFISCDGSYEKSAKMSAMNYSRCCCFKVTFDVIDKLA